MGAVKNGTSLAFSAGVTELRQPATWTAKHLVYDMNHYDFELLANDRLLSARRAVAIADLKAAWPIVIEMAEGAQEAGCRIRVTDETGAIVIMTGVAAARLHGKTEFAA